MYRSIRILFSPFPPPDDQLGPSHASYATHRGRLHGALSAHVSISRGAVPHLSLHSHVLLDSAGTPIAQV